MAGLWRRRMAGPALAAAVGATALWPALAAASECGLYDYRARIVRVVDGDTVEADIDLGFNTWRRAERLRLAGIDAPEPRGETRDAGRRAAEALRARIEGRELVICTIEDRTGSFGRYLVRIFDGAEVVNDWLLAEGLARRWPSE